jgi:cytochrome c553
MTFALKSVRTMAGIHIVLALLTVNSTHAQDVQQPAGICVACHAMSSVPANAINPIIWGQNQGYLYVQLRDFKRAARASESDASMHALTQSMSDAQMLAIAKYVSAQPWPKLLEGTIPPTDPLFRRGAQIVAYGDCGGCHFNNLQGYSANPRLRGQTPAYLTQTISEFRSGKRGNSPGMSDFFRVYDPDDIKAIVAYLSSAD